jgi:hypothetical protein
MPDSKSLAQNHTAILKTLNISAATLNRWVFAAPMLLLIPAVQLQARVSKLSVVLAEQGQQLVDMLAAEQAAAAAAVQDITAAGAEAGSGVAAAAADGQGPGMLSSSSSCSSNTWVSVARDPLQVLAYVSKDPRVLLLSPKELSSKLSQVSNELGLGARQAAWLVMSHPSYLAMEAGLVTNWMDDVRQLADMTLLQAKRLASCPQVSCTAVSHYVIIYLRVPFSGDSVRLPTVSIVCCFGGDMPN